MLVVDIQPESNKLHRQTCLNSFTDRTHNCNELLEFRDVRSLHQQECLQQSFKVKRYLMYQINNLEVFYYMNYIRVLRFIFIMKVSMRTPSLYVICSSFCNTFGFPILSHLFQYLYIAQLRCYVRRVLPYQRWQKSIGYLGLCDYAN